MKQKVAILFFILLSVTNGMAQKKLKGVYYSSYKRFYPPDTTVEVKEFVNGRAAFMIKGANAFNRKTNRVGFIDTTGKIIIAADYIDCSTFTGKYALATDTAYRTGVIDTTGKVIVPFALQTITICQDDLFIRQTRNKKDSISIVSADGKIIVPFGRYSNNARESKIFSAGGFPDGYTGGRFIWRPTAPDNLAFKTYIGVKTGEKWAAISRDGREIIPPKFDWIGIFKDGAAAMRLNHKTGLIDTLGNELIPPVYDNLMLIGDGLVVAIKDGRYGLLTRKNKVIIPFLYNYFYPAGNEAFRVGIGEPGETYKEGIISINGKIIIAVDNYQVIKFGSGYLVARNRNESMAVFNEKGVQKTAYTASYTTGSMVLESGINDGYIVYNQRKDKFLQYAEIKEMMFRKNGKWGLLDSAGEEVIKPRFDEFWYVWGGNLIAVKENGKWGFVSINGETMLPFAYDQIQEQTGRYFFTLVRNNKYGIANLDGKMVLPAVYDEIQVTSRGYPGILARIKDEWGLFDEWGKPQTSVKYKSIKQLYNSCFLVSQDNKFGLLNARGKEVVPCVYDNLAPYNDWPLITATKNGLSGLINYDGKIAWPLECKSIYPLNYSVLPCYLITRGDKAGMADTAGHEIFPFKYGDIFAEGPRSLQDRDMLVVRDKDHYGVANRLGELVVSAIYDDIRRDYDGTGACFYQVKSRNLFGVTDEAGTLLIPCAYDRIELLPNKAIIASKNGCLGVINRQQKQIIPFMYEEVKARKNGYIVRSGRKEGVLGLDGKVIVPIIYDYVEDNFRDGYSIKKMGKYGAADYKGKITKPIN